MRRPLFPLRANPRPHILTKVQSCRSLGGPRADSVKCEGRVVSTMCKLSVCVCGVLCSLSLIGAAPFFCALAHHLPPNSPPAKHHRPLFLPHRRRQTPLNPLQQPKPTPTPPQSTTSLGPARRPPRLSFPYHNTLPVASLFHMEILIQASCLQQPMQECPLDWCASMTFHYGFHVSVSNQHAHTFASISGGNPPLHRLAACNDRGPPPLSAAPLAKIHSLSSSR